MKSGRVILSLIAAIAVLALSASWFVTADNGNIPVTASGIPDKIELLYFHRTERCVSCNNAEQYARETLSTYYPDEVKSGKLSIQSIDYQKDTEMAKKYNVKMQGLKLRITKNGQESVKDLSEIWAYVRDKSAYMSNLKSALDKELGR